VAETFYSQGCLARLGARFGVNDITTLDAGKPNPAKPSSALAAR
jgi:hypothetical protein